MARYLKKYPTNDDVIALDGEDKIAQAIADLSAYEKREVLATYSGRADSITLRAYAEFLSDLQDSYSDAVMDRDFTIYRTKDLPELREAAIAKLASHRYYNPDEYSEYTEDDIKVI